jgi:hypothetical protein
MNGYNLIRNWYNFKFTNPSKVKASHSDMYCYLVDQWNRLGQKKEFGLPTIMTMECLGIGSYNTYKKVLNDLVDFGFVLIVKESINQHQSKIIALSNFDKALDETHDKALDKATIKAHDKALDKAPDTIIKQINKEQLNNKTLNNIDERKLKFASTLNPFVDVYGRDMINDFFKYWTEPNKSNTKFKQELEKTWSVERRLETWSKNDFGKRKTEVKANTYAPIKLMTND